LKPTPVFPHAQTVGLTPNDPLQLYTGSPSEGRIDVRALTLHAMWRMGKAADSTPVDESSGVITAEPIDPPH
jgi:hypothetical protein